MGGVMSGKRVATAFVAAVALAVPVLSFASPASAAGGVTLRVGTTAGLWDQSPVHVEVEGMPPNAVANMTINVASDPTTQYQFLQGVPTDSNGSGGADIDVSRFVNGFDCATAPGACILVASDPTDPFNRNDSVPVSFGRVDLFRFTPSDPENPGGGGTVGPPIGDSDQVAPGEWIWAQGAGLMPDDVYQLNQCKDAGPQLCRNTWNSSPQVFTDGAGAFGQPIQVGRNVFGTWGQTPAMSVGPLFDLRDGQTVAITATGMPVGPDYGDCGPGECWIGVRQPWIDFSAEIRSGSLTFSGDRVPVSATVSEALTQQTTEIVHTQPAIGTRRAVKWNEDNGTLAYAYTAVNRWLVPDTSFRPYSPPPVEAGRYDCADGLPFDPGTGATEPVHCSMMLQIVEQTPTGDELPFMTWQDVQFAAFDLGAGVNSASLGSSPAGVTLKGHVRCTGFSPEQYLVNVKGSLAQTRSGKRVVKAAFATTVSCSGTMANPGTAFWSVFVPKGFAAGVAQVTLDVSAAGFTRKHTPVHVVSTVTIRRRR